MNEQAKAWIDYYVSDLLSQSGIELDAEGCVKNPDVSKAMAASSINILVAVRWRMDAPIPVGYPEAKPAYLHDDDLQRIRAKALRDA